MALLSYITCNMQLIRGSALSPRLNSCIFSCPYSHQALLQQLETSHPRLLSELRLLMREAQRVTVTWEERWHTLLAELQTDVGKRCDDWRGRDKRGDGGKGHQRGKGWQAGICRRCDQWRGRLRGKGGRRM